MRQRIITIILIITILVVLFSSCTAKGNENITVNSSIDTINSDSNTDNTEIDYIGKRIPSVADLKFIDETELLYAHGFKIYHYERDFSLIVIDNDQKFLVVPDGAIVPENIDKEIVILQQPIRSIYLAATSAMALFDALDSVNAIRLCGTQASGWYIDSAVDALNSGEMIFAGKYSEPDYEKLISENCQLAIESTMIFHTPKVKDMLEDIGIPVLVDKSSYESHPLGRTEWIKLYAVLIDQEQKAEEFFNSQAMVIESLKGFENTGKSIAFFYMNSDGSIVIRNPSDYIPQMIDIAGGIYSFHELQTSETSTSITITMENFYKIAVNADYLIYNSSIDSPLSTMQELLEKDELFADFKAVKEGNVWCTGKSFYQSTDIVGQMINDINVMITTNDESQMTFLSRVE